MKEKFLSWIDSMSDTENNQSIHPNDIHISSFNHSLNSINKNNNIINNNNNIINNNNNNNINNNNINKK